MRRSCLVAGATGLIGSALVKKLSRTNLYDRIIVPVRRSVPFTAPAEAVMADYEAIDESLSGARADDIFCCLGTTIKKAGSEAAFRRVDFDYPLALGTWGQANGARRFFLVSSLGANPASRVFYNRVKGEVELAIGKLGYEVFAVMRPSLLLGHRSERRPGETIGKVLMTVVNSLLVGKFRKYRAIGADRVAEAMVHLAEQSYKGWQVYESDKITQLGGRYDG